MGAKKTPSPNGRFMVLGFPHSYVFWILLDVQQCVYQTKTPVWIRWWMVVPPKQPTTKNQNQPPLSIRQLYLHIRKPKKADVLNMNWISSTRVAPTHDRCMGSHLWRGFWQFWFFIEPSGVLEAIFSILKMIIFLVIYSFRCCPHHYGWYIPMKHTWSVVWDIFYFSIYWE
jgi:hypothetical protein